VTDMREEIRYGPAPGGTRPSDAAKRLPFDPAALNVTGTVAICEIDHVPTDNTRPSVSVSIKQYVRLSDDSLIRLDMDRGFTTVRYGAGPVSWKRTTDDLIEEVLALVQVDDIDTPGVHPWDELAQAARRRGVHVDAATLRGLPYQVVLSDELVSLFEL